MMNPKISVTTLLIVLLTTKCAAEEVTELTHENVETPGGDKTGYIMDSDFATDETVKNEDGDNWSPAWVKVNLGQVKCVQQADLYYRDERVWFTFSCAPGESKSCTCEEIDGRADCADFYLNVETVGTMPEDLQDRSDCIYGDMVKFGYVSSFKFYEIVLQGYEPGRVMYTVMCVCDVCGTSA